MKRHCNLAAHLACHVLEPFDQEGCCWRISKLQTHPEGYDAAFLQCYFARRSKGDIQRGDTRGVQLTSGKAEPTLSPYFDLIRYTLIFTS